MPITQDRLHAVVIAAQTLAQDILRLKRFAELLNLPDLVAQINAATERAQDANGRAILSEAAGALMSMHNTVQGMQIDTETLIILAQEEAHYKFRAKYNTRQAAYQRRKRQELGKGAIHPSLADAAANTADYAPLALSQELQDYLDGKTNALPPAQGGSERASFAAHPAPSNTPEEKTSSLAFDTRGKDVL